MTFSWYPRVAIGVIEALWTTGRAAPRKEEVNAERNMRVKSREDFQIKLCKSPTSHVLIGSICQARLLSQKYVASSR